MDRGEVVVSDIRKSSASTTSTPELSKICKFVAHPRIPSPAKKNTRNGSGKRPSNGMAFGDSSLIVPRE
jgi:hypothetical protein